MWLYIPWLLVGAHAAFLHVTDIHLDPWYDPYGSEKNVCHPGNNTQEYRPFGTPYSVCEAPPTLVKQLFRFIKNQTNNIDFIIWTGDSSR
jgi:endopolyphosphatase